MKIPRTSEPIAGGSGASPTRLEVCIGLVGPFGTGNMGDEAIQASVMFNIRQMLPSVRFVGISHNGADTAARHSIETFPIAPQGMGTQPPAWLSRLREQQTRNPFTRIIRKVSNVGFDAVQSLRHAWKTWRLMGAIDLLIISGGGQLSDRWGGPLKHPLMLWKWSLAARLRRKKLACLSVGGVMPRARLSRLLLKGALSRSHYRSFRDVHSRAVADRLGVPSPNRMFPDLAFGHPVVLSQITPESNAALTVGISPIAAQAWTRPEDPRYVAYIDDLTRFAKGLLEAGHAVRLVSSQMRMDPPVISGIFESLRLLCREDEFARLSRWEVCKVDDYLNAAKSVDVMVASRLHGVLLAVVAGTPVIGLSYDPKVAAFMEQIGMNEYCIEHDALTLTTLQSRFAALLAERLRVAHTIRRFGVEFREQTTHQLKDVLVQLLPAYVLGNGLPNDGVARVKGELSRAIEPMVSCELKCDRISALSTEN